MIRFWKAFIHQGYGIRKRDILSLNYLKTLSYTQLLKELITQSKQSHRKTNVMDSDKYLLLSSIHECQDLYKIASQLSSKMLVNKENKDDALMNSWRSITASGLQYIFNLSSIYNQYPYKNFINFFQNVKKSIQKNEDGIEGNIYSSRVNQLFAFGIPEAFNLEGISLEQKQKIKYGYVEMLYKLFENLQVRQNKISLGNEVDRLFPVELFNKSDQSLIKDIYLRYLYPNIKEGSGNQIVWLGRFGFPCDRIVQRVVKKIKDDLRTIGQQKKSDQTLRQMEKLYMLSIIYKKLLNLNPEKSQNSVKPALKQSKLFKELIELAREEEVGKIQRFFGKIKDDIGLSIFERERINNELKTELFKQHKLNFISGGNNQLVSAKISQLLIFQLLRFFLSLYNEQTHHPITPLQVHKLFSHQYVFSIIKKNIFQGSGFAEFFSQEEAFSFKFNLQLLEPQQKRYLNHVRNEYKSFIRRMSYDRHITEKLKNKSKRNNYLDHMLLSQSRIKFHQLQTEQDFSQKLNQQRIAKSLINDNQFLTFRIEKVIEDVIMNKLKNKLSITVQALANWYKYPYMPNLVVKGRRKTDQIYIKDILRENPRLASGENYRIMQIGKDTKNFNLVLLDLAKRYSQ